MRHVLPQLVHQATTARDQASALVRQAQQALQQARATHERLLAFRRECLSRSPAATLGRGDGAALADYQRFVSRLDEAIGQQARETTARGAHAEQLQQRLVQCQQRLLAFETLVRRDQQQQAVRDARREQVASDAFAARAASRAVQDFQP